MRTANGLDRIERALENGETARDVLVERGTGYVANLTILRNGLTGYQVVVNRGDYEGVAVLPYSHTQEATAIAIGQALNQVQESFQADEEDRVETENAERAEARAAKQRAKEQAQWVRDLRKADTNQPNLGSVGAEYENYEPRVFGNVTFRAQGENDGSALFQQGLPAFERPYEPPTERDEDEDDTSSAEFREFLTEALNSPMAFLFDTCGIPNCPVCELVSEIRGS